MRGISRLKKIAMHKRKILLSLAMMFLFFFCQGQMTHRYSNGLYIIQYQSPEGLIILYVPRAEPGGWAAGSVELKAGGGSQRAMAKNLDQLRAYTCNIEEETIRLDQSHFRIKTPRNPNRRVSIRDEKGKLLAAEQLSAGDAKEPIAGNSFYTCGEPAAVSGDFDADLDNSAMRFQGREVPLVAETNDALFFVPTEEHTGQPSYSITEGTESSTVKSTVLCMAAFVDKQHLRSGESTQLHIEIKGVNSLEQPAELFIQNNSADHVRLSGGNTQTILIEPGEYQRDVFTKTIDVTAAATGGFNIMIDLTPVEGSPPAASLLCNCYLEGRSFLLPPAACEELGGICDRAPGGDVLDEPDLPLPHRPRITLIRNEGMPTGVDIRQPDMAAARVTYRPAGTEVYYRADLPAVADGFAQGAIPMLLGNDGFYEVRVQTVDGNQQEQSRVYALWQEHSEAAFQENSAQIVFTVSSGEVRGAENELRRTNDEMERKQNEIDDLTDQIEENYRKAEALRRKQRALERIDARIDRLPDVYRPDMGDLLRRLDSLRRLLPGEIDAATLNEAADQARRRWEDCKDRLLALRQEKAAVEQAIADDKAAITEKLQELDKIFTDRGFTGRYGFHDNGRPYYGYIGDPGTDAFERADPVSREFRTLRRAYFEKRERLQVLNEEINEAGATCDELEQQYRDAQEAVARKEAAALTALEIEELCRQISSLLKELRKWCAQHPEDCNFADELDDLLEKCPDRADEGTDYLDDLSEIIKKKKQTETAAAAEADALEREMETLEEERAERERELAALEEQRNRQAAEADRLRRQRERELAAESERRRQEAERIEAERNRRNQPRAAPLLDEPVDPSDKQLKFQAQLVFKELYTELLINRGPCDCQTKAVALANNTNSIVADIIGGIGVGVFFAPLEAFPGIGLGGRLAIGVLKSIANAVFGGEDVSDELVKNLFSVIGGEMFPKLVGNEFTGNRLNDLAGKGIEEILEAEGVRALSWEGSTTLRDCGEVKGKTTLMINPNTGWVSILIRIEGCPLVVIKYRINEDGVAVSTPTVRTVRD
jgi:hypothetical protein